MQNKQIEDPKETIKKKVKLSEGAKATKKSYEKTRADSQLAVDNYVKYLSGGALVVSLTFISEILPEKQCCSYLIISAWTLLVLSLVVNFSSYFFTISNCNKTIDEIKKGSKDITIGLNKRNSRIFFLNNLSAILTITGIIAMTLFVTFNINNYG